jgi:abortive infection bacteriophage resistance protein
LAGLLFLAYGGDMTRVFGKPSLTVGQQIAHLKAQGMLMADEAQARHWLEHVSYYRLSAYWLPFEHPKGQTGVRFQVDTSFDLVTDLYEFDRHLRLLVLDAVERIEVAIRGAWAYALAHRGGPHGYLNAALYSDRTKFHDNLARLVRDVGTSPETYMNHYRNSYDDPAMPPVWMVAELMSFGQISRWYSLLADRALRNEISIPLGLPEAVMVPLLKHLSIIRNSCAHHARLWNRGFLLRMRIPQKPADLAASLVPHNGGPALLYNALTLMHFMLDRASPGAGWKSRLIALMDIYPLADLSAMGFPPDWRTRPLWT